MNDTAIKNFCTWARVELRDEMRRRLEWWGVREQGSAELEEGRMLDGRVLHEDETRQRAALVQAAARDGYDALVEQAAYTWFNRLVAVRYMELNDRLPCGVRMLSGADGAARPQCLDEALDVQIGGLDAARTAEPVRAADDEALLAHLLLAQCAELAHALPAVFEPIEAPLALLFPTGLLRDGGVVRHLVDDIPESDWREGVQIVGWMYQYYISEKKDEVFAGFKKGKKAERDTLPAATQLFTPAWIVSYLVQNSLGRLWMLNHPDSMLAGQMDYYIPPSLGARGGTESAELPYRRIGSPEDISVCDPACGSGHILVEAFRLLMQMYFESGYTARDAARLILEKNLSGFEIDPRAAQLASFALAMTACEYDSRFLRRNVAADITVLQRVEFTESELEALPELAARTQLVDALSHLDECGSLFEPDAADLAALEGTRAAVDAGTTLFAGASERSEESPNLFAGATAEKLARAQAQCKALSRHFDMVVANPPYMGSSSLGKWMVAWAKKHYPNTFRDLCTCFIERGFTLANAQGYSAMVTMQSWMFLGSFEKMRAKLLAEHSIASMAHLGARAFDSIAGEVVSVTAAVLGNEYASVPGAYLRLVDISGEKEKAEAARQAIANPTCGWFYRRNADAFKSIPGTPIAYWLPDGFYRSYERGASFSEIWSTVATPHKTADNDRYLRLWWEIGEAKHGRGKRWIGYSKDLLFKVKG